MDATAAAPARAVKAPRSPRLNLGCGRDYREDYENLDIAAGALRVDTAWDFLDTPWPYPDDAFEEIWSSHVFEHIPHTVPGTRQDGFCVVMDECWRVLKPGGRLRIVVPHPEGAMAWSSATHTRLVYPLQFREFTRGKTNTDYYAKANFRLLSSRVKRWPLLKGRWGWLDRVYDASPGLSKLLGVTPSEFHFELECVK